MTDKRAFEALLDEYVSQLRHGSDTERWCYARAAVLAAYDAGREGQPVCSGCHDTGRVPSLTGLLGGIPCPDCHPAPKAVKLPARQELFSDSAPADAAFVRGWNACLAAIAQRAGETG